MHKALLFLLFVLLLIVPKTKGQSVYYPEHLQQTDFVQGAVIFKLKAENLERFTIIQPIDQLEKEINISGVSAIQLSFPRAQKPSYTADRLGRKTADIRGIGTMQYTGNEALKSVLNKLSRTGFFEWVQPRFIHKPMFTPNDPQIAQQYHHALIKSFEAFDIEQGDTNVYIGITDAGIQFDHQDLGNVRYNYADPVNGIDDDGNGYIDDFRGWNTANNTNNPTATLSPHGMFTTGMSSATVNNGIGVAGNAYRCKFVPVRIDDANGFTFGYEGIVYLAELGCKFINASWGGTFSDPYGEEVIRYATVNKQTLIIAAAGNSGLNEKYYPASYEGVFSVAATGLGDVTWSGSTFGPTVDICAPGELLLSCWPFNGYEISSGTSFSAPLVTGAAALVKSHFPSYSAQQVAERLRITADTSIYNLSENAAVDELLGSGRLNMLRALTDPERPSVHYVNTSYVNQSGDSFLTAEDTVSLNGTYFNYLAAAQNLEITISTENAYIEIIDNSYTAGAIGSLSSQIQNSPFVFRILPDAPYNLDVVFKLRYSDAASGYFANEYTEVRINKDYIDLTISNLKTTITSRGSIGYNADYATDGIGIGFQNSGSQIYSAGFMLGSANQVADNVYADTLPGYDNDFLRELAVQKITHDDGSQSISSRYTTDAAGAQNLSIHQTADAQSGDNYVRLSYSIRNNGNAPATAVSAGIFADWDIQDYTQNKCVYDASNRMIYAFDESNPDVYFGIKLLSNQSANAYCFNNNGAGGSISLYDGFSNAEKFGALSGSVSRNASLSGEISALLGATLGSIQAGDSAAINFAILGESSLQNLTETAQEAQLSYNLSVLQVQIETNNENCAGGTGAVVVSSAVSGLAQVQLLDAGGIALAPPVLLAGTYNPGILQPGNYLMEISFSDGTYTQIPFSLLNVDPVTIQNLALSSEIVALPNATVEFSASVLGNVSVTWDFGDGNLAIGNPVTHTYSSTGTYEISCIAANASCSDTAIAFVEVGSTVGEALVNRTEMRLYPNPGNGQFKLTGLPNTGAFQVFNAQGKLVHVGNVAANIDLRHLESGMYFVRYGSEILPVVIAHE